MSETTAPSAESIRAMKRGITEAFQQIEAAYRSMWRQMKDNLKSIDWEKVRRMEEDRRYIQAVADRHRRELRADLDARVQAIYDDLGLERR